MNIFYYINKKLSVERELQQCVDASGKITWRAIFLGAVARTQSLILKCAHEQFKART